MLKVKTAHIHAVLAQKRHQKAICKKLGLRPDHNFDVTSMSTSQRGQLRDAIISLVADSPNVVKEFEAEQDKGAYTVSIIGIPGAYAVEASEYDLQGLFLTPDEAESRVMLSFGEFLVEPEYAHQPNSDQDEHDKWLASQTDEQLDALVQGVGRLARLKEQDGTLSAGNVLPESKSDKPPAK